MIEIDGASNNGVEAVRELRETVGFMPATGRFKIYIIDEVHMLSTAAFNALLKTLEEPPEHVIFIFATTEVQKIPATILSRCQRFDFRRISTRTITERLQLICKAEGVEYSEDALWLIARQGDGSMRDSQSLLDQVITFAGPNLQVATVMNILGLTDHELIKECLSAILHRDPAALGPALKKFTRVAVDPSLFLQQLIQDLRHLTMVKVFDADAAQMIDVPDSDLRALKDFSILVTEPDLQMLFDMALKGAQDVNRASEPQWALEMTLLRLASAPRWTDFGRLYQALDAASAAIPATEVTPQPARALPNAMPAAQSAAVASSSSPPVVAANQAPRPSSPPAPTSAPTRNNVAASANMNPQERWFEFVQKIKRSDSLLGAKLEPLFFLKAEGGKLELAAPANMGFLREQLLNKENREKIESLIEQHWGSQYALDVRISKDAGNLQAPTAQGLARQKAKAAESELIEQAEKNPKVASFNRVFQGRVQGLTPSKPPATKE